MSVDFTRVSEARWHLLKSFIVLCIGIDKLEMLCNSPLSIPQLSVEVMVEKEIAILLTRNGNHNDLAIKHNKLTVQLISNLLHRVQSCMHCEPVWSELFVDVGFLGDQSLFLQFASAQ